MANIQDAGRCSQISWVCWVLPDVCQDFSKIAAPLTVLMPTTTKKKQGKRKQPSQKPWVWEEEQETAFSHLKDILSSPPVLGYADYTLPFELHTDASAKALGAILYQEKDGLKRVIAYVSRALGKAERNYPAHKLEFLALKWAVTDKFKDYLYGAKFVVYTDNNPLTYVLSKGQTRCDWSSLACSSRSV